MMRQQTETKLILSIMNVLFWIVFIGLCINTGSIVYSFLVSIFLNEEAAKNLYLALNLFPLYELGMFHYITIGLTIIILTALKTYIAYLVVKVSTKLRLVQPFTVFISKLITRISHVALIAGILQVCAKSYYNGLLNKIPRLPSLENYLGEDGGFLFLAGIIFIIAQVFKRGLEIQSENELTI